jgi:uncharacterized membrane protein
MYASRPRRRGTSSPEQLARGLGWMSIGLGVAQLLAPRVVAKLCGVPLPASLMMLCGAREILCGAGLLTQEQPSPWMQARVAGDALDLAGLGAGLLLPGVNRRRIGAAAVIVGGIAAADLYCTRQLARYGRRTPPRHVVATIDVDSGPDEVYRFWRDLANLPRLIPQLGSVQVLDDVHSHWISKNVDGMRAEWDSEIIDDEPDARLAWRSVDGSQIYNAGSLEIERIAGGGTRLRVELLYDPPAESFASALANLFGIQLRDELRADLRTFKRIIDRQSDEEHER